MRTNKNMKRKMNSTSPRKMDCRIFFITPKIMLVIFSALQGIRCQTVIDKFDQEGIYLNDYCPKMENCAAGAHVMCMYYNPNRISHPRCFNFQNISATPEIADLILDLVNEIRGQIAMGKETGLNDELLPRGYGIFKLKWDNELATFAQVMANNCNFINDLCRATKTFPDPGQLAALVRYNVPDWTPIMHLDLFQDLKGFCQEKVEYAVQEAVKTWYKPKQTVTKQLIMSVPDYSKRPKEIATKLYLQLIDGKATHMGCGISAYREHKMEGGLVSSIVNAIQVVCNFSSQPKEGTSIYNTVKPKPQAERECPDDYSQCEERYKSKCGCPDDTAEDDRCLCTEPISYTDTLSCGKDRNCKPAVVLLPIFTVEETPLNLTSIRRADSKEFSPDFHDLQIDSSYEQEKNIILDPYSRKRGERGERDFDDSADHVSNKLDPYSRKKGFDYPSRNRQLYSRKRISLFNHNDNDEPAHYIVNSLEPPYSKKHVLHTKHDHSEPEQIIKNTNKRRSKESIFSKARKFGLRSTPTKKAIIKDVAPRKDFTDAKKALNTYLNKKRQKDVIIGEIHTEIPDLHEDEHYSDETTKITITVRPRFRIFRQQSLISNYNKTLPIPPDEQRYTTNNDRYLGFKLHDKAINEVDAHFPIEDSDKKLMTLLDNLEEEAKRVELDGTKREIFNAKLKKIYGTVLKTPEVMSSDSKHVVERHSDNERSRLLSDFDDIIFSDNAENPHKDAYERRMYDKDTLTTDGHFNGHERSIESLYARPQNTLRPLHDHVTDDYLRNINSLDEFRSKLSNTHKYPNYYGSDVDKDVKKLYIYTNDYGNQKNDGIKNIHKYTNNYMNDKDEDVKSLSYKIQVGEHDKHLRRHKKIPKLSLKKKRIDDKQNKKINIIDNDRTRNDHNIMSDYEDEKSRYYNSRNHLFNNGYDQDYQEEPLSAERRIFYQEKLDDLERKKFLEENSKPISNAQSPDRAIGKMIPCFGGHVKPSVPVTVGSSLDKLCERPKAKLLSAH